MTDKTDTQPVTILTIDDDESIRTSFSMHLEDSGYRVLTAENGREGLAVFEQHKPDLILVDLRMPEVDGMEVIASIHTQSPETPIIVVSGAGRLNDAMDAVRRGAWDYITKPVGNLLVLNHAIGKALERSRLLRENREYQQSLERKVAERTVELEKANLALRESEERYRGVFEGIPDGVLIHDSQGTILDVNDSMAKRLEIPRKELLGRNLSGFVTQENALGISDNATKVLAGHPLVFETTYISASGRVVPAEVHESSIRWKRDREVLSISRDITDRLQAEQEREQLERQYQQAQKMESVGQLAGGIAHDLNNLLSPILGYGEMMLEDFAPSDSRADLARQIYQAGLRARDLIRRLLAFSRRQALETNAVNLNQVISDFEELLRRTIREDIKIELKLGASLRSIQADVGQIEQVIMNLAVNAQDAMPSGGRLAIETAVVELDIDYANQHQGVVPGEYVMLAVSDTGCGMDRETCEKIFEPFFTTKRKGEGTGLGLATIYGIIKQHRGNIWVYSEPNKGTVFKVYFPAGKIADTSTTEGHAEIIGTKGTETILLVEDDKQVRDLTRAILKRYGYEVLLAETGHDALDVLETHKGPVDLVLTDVIMPDMSGRELVSEVAENYPTIKAIFMSGYTESVIADRGVLTEDVAFIQKPFTIQGLTAKVREVLDSD